MTPLDFRLIAIPFFSLIGLHCSQFIEAVKRIEEVFSDMRHTSRYLLSTSSFNQQVTKISGSFYNQVDDHLLKASASSFIMFSLRQANVQSALHTNAFQTVITNSNVYVKVKNVYPLYDDAAVINVSYKIKHLLIVSYFTHRAHSLALECVILPTSSPIKQQFMIGPQNCDLLLE